MDNYVYTITEYGAKKHIRRVNRTTARKLYNSHKTVYACASNIRPDGYWTGAIPFWDHDNSTFEQLENEFYYYQCTAETGRRIKYFAEVTQ